MERDEIFNIKQDQVKPFEFNQDVANVFDDMAQRSIPNYHESHRLVARLLPYVLRPGSVVYDLGCSTGTGSLNILQEAKKLGLHDLKIIAVDNSPSMIDKAKERLQLFSDQVEFLCSSVEEIDFKPCSLVLMNYTLQFIRPEKRAALVDQVFKALVSPGLFVLSEKIHSKEASMQELLTDIYYQFKRDNGYGQLEIDQKRQALENYLITWTAQEHLEQLEKSGFTKKEMLLRWCNFACFVGMK